MLQSIMSAISRLFEQMPVALDEGYILVGPDGTSLCYVEKN